MEEAIVVHVDAMRQDVRESLREIVNTHSREVFRLAYRLTGNEQDAEEVVQETFLTRIMQEP